MEVNRAVQLLVDGQIVTEMRDQGEKLEVRVRRRPVPLPATWGSCWRFACPPRTAPACLWTPWCSRSAPVGLGNIRHYDFRRAITVEADIEAGGMDTVTANRLIVGGVGTVARPAFPDIDLNFSGELDDIQESIDAIGVLFIFGVGLMYLILGTQFRSYWQPFMILATVPMAFTGVVAGLHGDRQSA